MSPDLAEVRRRAFLALPPAARAPLRQRMGRLGPWEDGRPPTAPACPAGMEVAPPDFVGVGVSKCGTSWWFSLVARHPDVDTVFEKELGYFNRTFFERERRQGITDEDLAAYHQWFPRRPGRISGEWTPHYVFARRLPPYLVRAAPGARLLVMVRDPVERYRSDISRRMPGRVRDQVRVKGALRGCYASELGPWEEVYDRGSVLMLQYEACTADPAGQLAATYRFLGLDDTYRPPDLTGYVNRTATKRPVADGLTRMLAEVYETEVLTLAGHYPELDLARWPNFAHLA